MKFSSDSTAAASGLGAFLRGLRRVIERKQEERKFCWWELGEDSMKMCTSLYHFVAYLVAYHIGHGEY